MSSAISKRSKEGASKLTHEKKTRKMVSARSKGSKEGASRLIHDDSLPEVFIACEVRLLSVDDAAEAFRVALLIHAHYEDNVNRPEPRAQDGFERDNDYDGFIPEITMVNCMDAQYEQFQITIRRNRKTGTVWTSFYNTCVISESLELEKFPFDRQLFRVPFKSSNAKIRSWKIDASVLDFPRFPEGYDDMNEEEAIFLVSCELKHWRMNSFFTEYFSHDDDPASLTQGEMQLTIKVERDPKYYFFNFYLVMYLIVLANICLMSIPTTLSAERNTVTITLLLTLVAFKFVLMEGTPKVGYLTYMDKYVVVAFMFSLIGLVENIAVSPNLRCGFINESDCDELGLAKLGLETRETDLVFQIGYGIVWTIFNLGVAFICAFPNSIRTPWEVVEVDQIGATVDTLQRSKSCVDGSYRIVGGQPAPADRSNRVAEQEEAAVDGSKRIGGQQQPAVDGSKNNGELPPAATGTVAVAPLSEEV